MAQPTAQFDSHIDLTRVDFERCRAVIFHGASGSGKSTYIRHLVRTHRGLCDRPYTHIDGGPIDWSRVDAAPERLIIVDELLSFRDLVQVAGLLRAGHLVIAASHLPPRLTGSLRTLWPLQQFATDRDPAKIERFLSNRGVSFSSAVVARYCARYGATYTDAEIILDHTGGDDFDRAYARFARLCTIDPVKPRRAWF